MRRLSKPELIGTWRQLFGASVVAAASFDLLQNENPKDPGLQFDPGAIDFDALFTTVSALADATLADPAARTLALGNCDGTTSASCLSGLTDTFAPRAFGRPLTDDERTLYQTYAMQAGLRLAMVRVAMAPAAAVQLELDGTVQDNRVRLTAYEVARRLALELTQAGPDDTLLAAAAGGSLDTLDQVRAQGRRLLATDGARARVTSLLTTWLGLDQVSDPHPTVAKGLSLDGTGFGEEARQELLRFATYVTVDQQAPFERLFTDKTAFPSSARLAAIFGVPQGAEPAQLSDVRGGVLMRPATGLSTSAHSNPILRGVEIRTRVLCDSLPPPPVDAVAARMTALGTLSPLTMSTREIDTETTSPDFCMGCHHRINPLGYPLEQLGPMGELRTEEKVWDDTGAVVATHPLDLHVDDVALIPTLMQSVDGAQDLMQLLAGERKVKQCFATHLVMDTRMRPSSATDGCTINEATAQLEAGAPALDALLLAVASEDILWRAAP
jgi:uncharacterized metal-binding protein